MLISPECLKALLNQGYGPRSIRGGNNIPDWLPHILNNFSWSCNNKLFQVPESVIAWELAKTYQHLINK